MLCRKPFVKGISSYGCGQCMPCRFNRRRVWTHRLMLEALVHTRASFVTLTYDKEHVPADGSLEPVQLQLFIKRWRKSQAERQRYFAVGEYGDESWRPHYHMALFGYGGGVCSHLLKDSCEWCRPLREAWTYGACHVGELTHDSAQYVCGYTVKKLTKPGLSALEGRYPEFARMSLRPGIGAVAVGDVVSALQSEAGWQDIGSRSDVPEVLRHGRRSLPLGRYMRMKLRQSLGMFPKESDEAFYKRTQALLDLYKSYVTPEEDTPFKAYLGKERYDKAEKQKARNLVVRMKIGRGKKL